MDDTKAPEQLEAEVAALAASDADAAKNARTTKLVKARVLVDGAHGKINSVVELSAKYIAQGVKTGLFDDSDAAVAYAESLAAPKA